MSSMFLAISVLVMTSDIRSDEVVEFYATSAYQDVTTLRWTVPIHGVIFEPEEDSLKRQALIALVRRAIKLDKHDERSEIFRARLARFLVDNERGKEVVVRVGKHRWTLPKSGANGHFQSTFELTAAQVDELLKEQRSMDRWATFHAELSESDERSFVGRVQFVEPRGVSVVSDIDDTIKVSAVSDRAELIRNTFLRPAKAVDGMAEVYARWAERGASFHYISASPWQLVAWLEAFRDEAGFPRGSFQLRNFRLKDASAVSLFSSSVKYKQQALEQLLVQYPQRRFVLVGDAAENDAQVYAAAYRKHPEQVVWIAIRIVGDRESAAMQVKKAMANVPANKWQAFTAASELETRTNTLFER